MQLRWPFVAAVLVILGAFWALTQPLFSLPPVPRALETASPEALKKHVVQLSEKFTERDFYHPKVQNSVVAYLSAELKSYGLSPIEQRFDAEGRSYSNLRVLLGPSKGPRVVVGAHYDCFGGLPGADDNASGVAGALELARMLSRPTLAGAVEIVFYANEEPPAYQTDGMGSVAHARLLKAEGTEVRAMLSLEMIGYFNDASGSQSFPMPLLRLFYPSRGSFIAVIGSLTDLGLVREVKKTMAASMAVPVYSMNGPAIVPGVDFSDHRSYWAEGFPAVMITDTSFYRNKNYHTEKDRPETLDYFRMAQVVQGVGLAVLRLAGGYTSLGK